MNTKIVPTLITLVAAAISCVMSIMQGADFTTFVKRLFITVLVFLVIGTIIKMILDKAFVVIDESETDDEATTEENDSDEDNKSEGSSTNISLD